MSCFGHHVRRDSSVDEYNERKYRWKQPTNGLAARQTETCNTFRKHARRHLKRNILLSVVLLTQRHGFQRKATRAEFEE